MDPVGIALRGGLCEDERCDHRVPLALPALAARSALFLIVIGFRRHCFAAVARALACRKRIWWLAQSKGMLGIIPRRCL